MSFRATLNQWLGAALPAMVTLLIGWLLLLRPALNETSLLRRRLETLDKPGTQRQFLAQAQAEHASLEQDIQAKQLTLTEQVVFDRNQALQNISQLCEACDLSLAKSHPDPATQPPLALKEAFAARAPDSPLPQVWRLELYGSYPNVVKLLSGVQRITPLVVPLNVSMQPGKNGRPPAKWILTLWL